MNRPLTDRDRLWALEAENAELREELAAYKANERGDVVAQEYLRREAAIRRFLGHGRGPSGRYTGVGPAAILLHLIDRAGSPVSTQALFNIRLGAEDANSRVIDVQVCSLRRALERNGYSDAIVTMRGRGYMLEPWAADRLRREVL
jgi:hypothetical protein